MTPADLHGAPLPGPELDALIAGMILEPGWYISSPRSDSVVVHNGEPWMPSTNMGDAWDIVEHFCNSGDQWHFELTKAGTDEYRAVFAGPTCFGISNSAPHAICLAAIHVAKALQAADIKGSP